MKEKSLYDELLEKKKKAEADALKEKEAIALKIKRDKQFREAVLQEEKREKRKRNLIVSILVLFVGIPMLVVFLLFLNRIGFGNRGHYYDAWIEDDPRLKYHQAPVDVHPEMQEVNYGEYYFQAGVWYKYFEIDTSFTIRQFYFKSMTVSGNDFEFQPLGYGVCAVSSKLSDSVLVTPE